jgi:GNAT superfamily N-acetyltransferase
VVNRGGTAYDRPLSFGTGGVFSVALKLVRASIEDAELIWKLQTAAFAGLLSKYQDFDTNPGNEPIEKVMGRLEQPFSYYYFILMDEETVGAIRIVDRKDGSRKRISQLFVLPQYWNKGIAQWAMTEAEKIHGSEHWMLDTILQEKGNCHLYEKMGYQATGETKAINERMTLVFYEKSF